MKNTESKTQLTVVETSLQQSFNGISPAELCAAFTDTERKRADWLVSAVMFGLKCIAAKPQIKHGDFWNFISKAIKDKDGKSLATARRYMGLAGKIMAQVAMPDATNEIGARVVEYFKGANGKKPKFERVLSTEEGIREILKFLLEGLSLHGLTKALQGADARAALEDNLQKKLGGELPKRSIQSADPAQSDFFDLLDRDIFSIDEKIKSRELARLPKDKVLAYADALIERGERLRAAVEKASEE